MPTPLEQCIGGPLLLVGMHLHSAQQDVVTALQ
jgi:hypothetical protein